MAKFWFTSAPLPGHLDWGGVLKTAQVLRARGHDVQWVSEERIRPLVERAGVPFAAIPHSGWRWPPPPMPEPRERLAAGVDFLTLRYRRALERIPALSVLRRAFVGRVMHNEDWNARLLTLLGTDAGGGDEEGTDQ